MAIVAANGQDPNQQGQTNLGGGGTIMSGGMPTGGGGGASSAYQGPAASGATPSGTPNIQQYLAANQGAGQRLSGAITGNVQNQASQIGQQVNQQQQSLQNQYQPLNQQVQGGQQAANVAFQDPQALLNAYNAAQQQSNPTPGTTPTAPNAQDLSNYNAFQANVAGTSAYNQQQNQIASYGQAGQQANQALQAQLGMLGQTTAMGANQMGQNQLLQQTVGTPNYSSGQQALDALFLQGQGQQLQNNLNNIYNQTNQNVTGLSTDTQNKLAALQQLSGQNAAYTQNLFANGVPGQQGTGLNQIAGNVAQEAAALQQSAPQQQAAIQQAFQNNTFTPQQLQQLGLTQGQQTWGLTAQDIMNAGNLQTPSVSNLSPTALNAAAANPQEFARYNALNQLAGNPQQSIFGGATTAGGYNPVSFNAAGLQTAIQNQEANVKSDYMAQVQDLYNAIQNQASTQGTGFTWSQPIQNMFDQESGTLAGIMNSNGANFNPSQAEQVAQQFANTLDFGGRGAGGTNFENWYNSTFTPDITAQINAQGETAPVNNPNVHMGTPISPTQTEAWNNLINQGFS